MRRRGWRVLGNLLVKWEKKKMFKFKRNDNEEEFVYLTVKNEKNEDANISISCEPGDDIIDGTGSKMITANSSQKLKIKNK